MDLSSVAYPLPRGWRNESESGGGMNRNRVALSIGFGWRIASEYAGTLTPIVELPDKAFISDDIRSLIPELVARNPLELI